MKYSSIVEALTEVRLDRAGDHVAAGVGHQATHAGDLADLHHVPSGARADHHVDGVELLGLERASMAVRDLVGGLGPDLHFLLAALAVGDDALAELVLDLVGLLLVAVEDLGLLDRRLDVLDRDREARPRGEAEAEVLDGIEAAATYGLGVLAARVSTILPMSFLSSGSRYSNPSGSVALKNSRPAVGLVVLRLAVLVGARSSGGT